MRKTLLFGAAALIGVIGTDPAFCLQNGMPTTSQAPQMPDAPIGPDTPSMPPVDDPSQPAPPITEPLPPEMPPVAGEARDVPPVPSDAPVTMRTDAPAGPMATPPSIRNEQAISGGTTRATMMPQPATKAYPLCTRTLQDSCRNPGEGPGAPKNRRR
jgi:hypothetical protein